MVAFANTFLSYVVLMLIIVLVAGVAITIGITLRKRKNNKLDTAIIENNTEE